MWRDSYTHSCLLRQVRDVTHSYGTWLVHNRYDSFLCDMAYARTPHLSISVTWLVYMSHGSFMFGKSYSYVTWIMLALSLLQQECGRTYGYVWHDSFLRALLLILMCGTTHSCVWYDSFLHVIWLLLACDIAHSCEWYDSILSKPIHSLLCMTWLRMFWKNWAGWVVIDKLPMGWLRWVGSLNCRSLLQTSPTKETISFKRDLSF